MAMKNLKTKRRKVIFIPRPNAWGDTDVYFHAKSTFVIGKSKNNLFDALKK